MWLYDERFSPLARAEALLKSVRDAHIAKWPGFWYIYFHIKQNFTTFLWMKTIEKYSTWSYYLYPTRSKQISKLNVYFHMSNNLINVIHFLYFLTFSHKIVHFGYSQKSELRLRHHNDTKLEYSFGLWPITDQLRSGRCDFIW